MFLKVYIIITQLKIKMGKIKILTDLEGKESPAGEHYFMETVRIYKSKRMNNVTVGIILDPIFSTDLGA